MSRIVELRVNGYLINRNNVNFVRAYQGLADCVEQQPQFRRTFATNNKWYIDIDICNIYGGRLNYHVLRIRCFARVPVVCDFIHITGVEWEDMKRAFEHDMRREVSTALADAKEPALVGIVMDYLAFEL